ncbi:protein kinase [Spiractinospora alimapuensis]|uniref:serine/threonine-protein kinase n=1 Tax=Spiractinospora alimapuensis TaxID=2820884 RepID=UPI001F1B9CB4|nr:serine/threonine-protein kinase [Spiractinospora alimapuensis]QVQ55191.1 protein kinase [Spiractinospora alimapuensis]
MGTDDSNADEASQRVERVVGDRYRLTEELGRGGMGRVWRAHDTRLDRTVAVKELLLPAGMAADERARLATRMEREARAAAMGSHPGIVSVHDVVEHDGRPWIVMEFLSGRSLRDLVQSDGPVAARNVARWVGELLDALVTAHRLGIVHRDVKPANVMITESGRAVLTDFGIAQVSGASDLTGTSGVVGSPGYIAPERLHFVPATPASDLWSLGATTYYAVQGVGPFQRATAEETVRAALSEEPAPIHAEGSLPALVAGLLRKEPAQRMTAEQARALLDPSGPGGATPPQASGAAASAVPATDAPTVVNDQPPSAPAVATPAGATPTSVFAPSGQETGTLVAPSGPAPTPRRSRLSWPLVAMVLGTGALLVVAVAIVVFATGGEEPSPAAARQDASADDASPSEDDAPGPDDADPVEEDDQPEDDHDVEPTPDVADVPGVELVNDPDGFQIAVPDGWTRRVDGSSIYYNGPRTGTFLQIDSTPHPMSDQLAHVEQNESETIASGRLPGYERIRVADVTDSVPGDHTSVAEWEFEWTSSGGERRHMLSRNFTLANGDNVSVAWAAPSEDWTGLTAEREAALDSYSD